MSRIGLMHIINEYQFYLIMATLLIVILLIWKAFFHTPQQETRGNATGHGKIVIKYVLFCTVCISLASLIFFVALLLHDEFTRDTNMAIYEIGLKDPAVSITTQRNGLTIPDFLLISLLLIILSVFCHQVISKFPGIQSSKEN